MAATDDIVGIYRFVIDYDYGGNFENIGLVLFSLLTVLPVPSPVSLSLAGLLLFETVYKIFWTTLRRRDDTYLAIAGLKVI